MLFRYIMIGFLSLTSLSLFTYQGIEIFQAFMELFKGKEF
jgi:hypothetical protein